ALLTGHSRADQVAAIFGMHSRTMHRRLQEFGVGFRQLVDESRFAFAQQLMQGSSLDLARISEMVGYAAPGVFTRAFHRWSGMAPAEWRAADDRERRAAAPTK
ncbi:MAG: AraC family transcriptional regulator, partial [Burkholderiaceae bacterium]